MPLTLRALVADPDLGLVARCGKDGLDQEVAWVAVSELPDPTPWLEGTQLLLTSGMWLTEADDRAATADGWASRLREAGARAVGFGVEPWFESVPEELLRAARRHRLTLLEVPERTPFVAVDRRVADLLASEARRHQSEIIRSQQRLARAATGGSSAVVATLARELRSRVVLLGADHRVTLTGGELPDVPEHSYTELAREAEVARRRSLMKEVRGHLVYLVPLGPHDNRVGTLCVAGPAAAIDAAGLAGMVGTAAALLTVLLPATDIAARSVVVELLMSGDHHAAARLGDVAGIALPEPLVAIAFTGPAAAEKAGRALSLGAWHVPAPRRSVHLVIAAPDFAAARVPGLLAEGPTRAGISAPHPARELQLAVHEAVAAAELTRRDRPHLRFENTVSSRLGAVLASPSTQQHLASLLAPLEGHPERVVLLETAAHWLRANGRWDPAAAAAGVHRETVRARVHRLGELLDLDLTGSDDRLALALAVEARLRGGPSGTAPR